MLEKMLSDNSLTRRRLTPVNHWDWHVKTPFSHGWKIGPFIFLGGQLSANSDGSVLGLGDIEIQTRNVFENIGRVLKEAGATWRDVVKLNTYYVFEGPEEGAQAFWEKMTKVRLQYIADPGPAATAVRVSGLMYDGFLIEADVIAFLDPGKEK